MGIPICIFSICLLATNINIKIKRLKRHLNMNMYKKYIYEIQTVLEKEIYGNRNIGSSNSSY